METKKYVRIKQAKSSDLAYSVYIGRVFTVIGENENEYILHSVNVLKEDAEVIVTENRKAAVGERVLITNGSEGVAGRYRNGDVGVVSLTCSKGAIICEINELEYVTIFHNEYEVIVNNEVKNEEADGMEIDLNAMEYDELIAHSEDVMRAIRLRAYGEGYRQGKFDAEMDTTHGQAPIVSAQARRDEIVEQTKADVDLCAKSGTPIPSDILKFWPRDKGKERYLPMHEVEYVVNHDKRTVVSLIKRIGGGVVAKGIAKAAPSDCFNVHIGRAIALRRALGLAVPDEYLNAPQPTEVRVGDVVRSTVDKSKKYVIAKGEKAWCDGMAGLSSMVAKYGRIIDDSREEVGE